MTRNIVGLVLVAALFTACKKKDPEVPVPEPAPVVAPAPAARFEAGPVIDPISFETAVTAVAATELGSVQKAAELLNGDSEWKVIIVGLADAAGDDATNKLLSQQRADAVADELRKLVSNTDGRILSQGIGERLATGTTQSERKVEFVFYKGGEDMAPRQIVMRSGVLETDFREKRGN